MASPQFPLFSVRLERNKTFFGRQNVLDGIDTVLLPEQSTVNAFALCGMSGIGKTELALEYAYSRRKQFDAVFWLRAEKEQVLSLDFAQIAGDLGLMSEVDTLRDPVQAARSVKAWLANPIETLESTAVTRSLKWLMIFDHVDMLNLISRYLPIADKSSGSIIFTSRHSLVEVQKLLPRVGAGINLEPLGDEQSIDLLRFLSATNLNATSPDEEEGKQLADVSQKLGGRPMLISRVSSMIRRQQMPLRQVSKILDTASSQWTDTSEKIASAPHDVLFRVASKLGLSSLSPSALRLLNIASLLNPDRIPERILQTAFECKEDLSSKEELQYEEAKKELILSSLLFFNVENHDFHIHRLVQSTTWRALSDVEQAASLKAVISCLATLWPFSTYETRFETSRYKACAYVLPHVERLREVFQSQPNITLLVEQKSSIDVAVLIHDAGVYSFERGFAEEGLAMYDLGESISENITAPDSERLAALKRATINERGCAMVESNRPKEGLQQQRKFLEYALRHHEEAKTKQSQYELGLAYNEVGVAEAYNSQWTKAIEQFLESSRVFKSAEEGYFWPETNLGFMYWIDGRLEEAEQVLNEILKVREASHGIDDHHSFKTGKILYALGNVYTDMGRYKDGKDCHLRAYHQYIATLGAMHHRVGDCCHRLADHAIRERAFEDATTYIEEALLIFNSRPYLRQEVARSTHKQAQMLEAMKGPVEAEGKFEEAFRLRMALVPEDQRERKVLKEKDFNDLVIFWSR